MFNEPISLNDPRFNSTWLIDCPNHIKETMLLIRDIPKRNEWILNMGLRNYIHS